MLRPEDVWPVDRDYIDDYERAVVRGKAAAGNGSAIIVSIARNAAGMLPNTLGMVEEVRQHFARCDMFVFENDSTDGTDKLLADYASSRPWFKVRSETWGGEDARGFEPERTERLAKARNICHDHVGLSTVDYDWTIVLDLDPEYGFSVDGVFNSISQLGSEFSAMASYSLMILKFEGDDEPRMAHYDSWAARPNWWRDRRNEPGGLAWFSAFLPPVGSPPLRLNSAFGGLCVYKTEAYLSGRYSGEDCEHVPFHRRMAASGHRLAVNPGCRYIAIWRP